MSDVNLSDFKALYLTTAQEYLQKIDQNLSALSPDPANAEAIEAVHISSHSLKSQSLVMGYQTTGELSHVLELIFRKLHDEKRALAPELFPHIQEAVKDLHISLDHIKADGTEIDLSSKVGLLKEVTGV